MTKLMEKLTAKSMAKSMFAVLFSVCLFGPSAWAQVSSSTQGKSQTAPSAQEGPPPAGSADAGQPEEATPNTAPVLYISSVEAISSAYGPTLHVIRVRGITST